MYKFINLVVVRCIYPRNALVQAYVFSVNGGKDSQQHAAIPTRVRGIFIIYLCALSVIKRGATTEQILIHAPCAALVNNVKTIVGEFISAFCQHSSVQAAAKYRGDVSYSICHYIYEWKYHQEQSVAAQLFETVIRGSHLAEVIMCTLQVVG